MLSYGMINHLTTVGEVCTGEMNLFLCLARNIDWHNRIQISEFEIARQIKTSVRYVRQMIKRQIQRGSIIVRDGVRYLKATLAYTRVDYELGGVKYCKHFAFLESNSFHNLTLTAKRILLHAAYDVAAQKLRRAFFSCDLLRVKYRLSPAMAQTVMDEINHSPFATTELTEEGYTVEFNAGVLEEETRNDAMDRLIQRIAIQYGYHREMTPAHREAVQSVMLSVYRHCKGYLDLAEKVCKESLIRMAAHIQDKWSVDEFRAYFQTVIQDILGVKAGKLLLKQQYLEDLRYEVSARHGLDKAGVVKDIEDRKRPLQESLTVIKNLLLNWFKGYTGKVKNAEKSTQQSTNIMDKLVGTMKTVFTRLTRPWGPECAGYTFVTEIEKRLGLYATTAPVTYKKAAQSELVDMPAAILSAVERHHLGERSAVIQQVYMTVKDTTGYSTPLFVSTLTKEAVIKAAKENDYVFEKYLLKAVMNNMGEIASTMSAGPAPDITPPSDEPAMVAAWPVVQKLKRDGQPIAIIRQKAIEAVQDALGVQDWTEAKKMFDGLNLVNPQ